MKFFKDEKQRNLWLRLNAEHIRFTNYYVRKCNVEDLGGDVEEIEMEDLGDFDTVYSPYWVSKNQLEYDEKNRDAPRLSLEELSALSQEEILAITQRRNGELLKEIFQDMLNNDEEL